MLKHFLFRETNPYVPMCDSVVNGTDRMSNLDDHNPPFTYQFADFQRTGLRMNTNSGRPGSMPGTNMYEHNLLVENGTINGTTYACERTFEQIVMDEVRSGNIVVREIVTPIYHYNFEWDNVTGMFVDVASAELKDASSKAIGVAACDIDGDGHEELYILNTDQYSGSTSTSDRLIDLDTSTGQHIELFGLAQNQGSANYVAGRSCACVDR